jgi:hypothetical protein
VLSSLLCLLHSQGKELPPKYHICSRLSFVFRMVFLCMGRGHAVTYPPCCRIGSVIRWSLMKQPICLGVSRLFSLCSAFRCTYSMLTDCAALPFTYRFIVFVVMFLSFSLFMQYFYDLTLSVSSFITISYHIFTGHEHECHLQYCICTNAACHHAIIMFISCCSYPYHGFVAIGLWCSSH